MSAPIHFHFATVEAPGAAATLAADPPPFAAGLELRAEVWTHPLDPATGRVRPGAGERIGEAAAFAAVVDPAFPPGTRGPFLLRLDLPVGRLEGLGHYTVLADDLPERGIVTASCALRVERGPLGGGGVLTSVSTFNPGRLPGHATGSRWTLLLHGA